MAESVSNVTNGGPYSILVAGGDPDRFPAIVQVTEGGIEYAGLGSILLSVGFLSGSLPPLPPTLDACQGLAVLLASREIDRLQGRVRADGGPYDAWPLHVTRWTWANGADGAPASHRSEEVIGQSRAADIERSYRAHTIVAALAPSLLDDASRALDRPDLSMTDIASIAASYTKLTLNITTKTQPPIHQQIK